MRNRKIYLLLLVVFIINFSIFMPHLSATTSIIIEWSRRWGGDNADYLHDMTVDSADNIYLMGYTFSFGAGDSDFYLVKYNNSGARQWNKTWGGSGFDYGYGMAFDSSENIYLAGDTESFGAGLQDICLVKYNSLGIFQWNVTWGGNLSDGCEAIALDSSNNIYLAGSTKNFGALDVDACLVRFNNQGVYQWNRTWGGNYIDNAKAIIIDSSDNIYITGIIRNTVEHLHNNFLIKFDSSGELIWNRTWGESMYELSYALAIDSSNNIYIVGQTVISGEWYYNASLVKYDSSGILLWNKTWGGEKRDGGYAIVLDSLENIYITGCTKSFGAGGYDMCLLKYDNSGEFQWYRTWGGTMDDGAYAMAIDSSENIFIGGIQQVLKRSDLRY